MKTSEVKRTWYGSSYVENFLYGNNTGCDLSDFHKEISASLLSSGTLPEEFSDLFIAVLVPNGNPDGSPRYMIHPKP